MSQTRLVAALLLVALVLAPWGLWLYERAQRRAEVASLRRELQTLAAPRIRDAAQQAQRTGVPQRLQVLTPAGRQEVRVERVEVPVPVLTPGGVQVVEVPRVVTVTPPVPCRTEAECRALYGSAPQSVTVQAELPAGTVVPVRVLVDGEEHEVNAPLARPIPISVHLVLSERGVFHALQPEGSPLQVTEVRTETTMPLDRGAVDSAPTSPTRPKRPWRIAAGLAGPDEPVLALEYENEVAGGWYRLQLGWQVAHGQPYAAAWLVFPLR